MSEHHWALIVGGMLTGAFFVSAWIALVLFWSRFERRHRRRPHD